MFDLPLNGTVSVTAWRQIQFSFILGFAALLCVGNLAAQDQRSTARTQDEQQRVRALLQDLLSGVLDTQLRQLEENGLSDQEIYRDVQIMRAHLKQVVDEEMPAILDQLRGLEPLTKEQREALFVEIRQRMRSVVRQVSIERQELLKRLRLVELAEQTRELIRRQIAVQTEVRGISAIPSSRRAELILTSIENQRDVKELFLQFAETLSDSRTRSGPLATAATDALRIMTVAETGTRMDRIHQQLRRADFPTTLEEQERIIASWKEILPLLEQAQGTFHSELAATIELIRGLIQRQETLREDVRRAGSEPIPATVIERQSKLAQELAGLQTAIQADATIQSQLHQAETSAMDSATALLDNKTPQTIANQGKVLGNLLAVLKGLQDLQHSSTIDRSAEELRLIVKSLLVAKQSVTAAQDRWASKVPDSKTDITEEIDSVSKTLHQTANNPRMIKSVVREFTATNEMLIQIRKSFTEASTIDLPDIERLRNSLNDAVARISASIEDTRNREAAVTIGELIRAAEVLERLAADQRSVTRQIEQTSSTAFIQRLADHQAEAIAVTEKLAQALKPIASPISSEVVNGAEKASQIKRLLTHSIEQSTQLDHQSVSNLTSELADDFAQAARQIRVEIDATATEFVSRTSVRATELETARTGIEQAIEQHPKTTGLIDLEFTRQQLQRALEHQLIAKGNTNAATALRILDAIRESINAQHVATEAANDSGQGTGQERKAVTSQAEVAELIQRALAFAERRAESADAETSFTDELIILLKNAQREATQSARLTLEGNNADAGKARKSTESILTQSLERQQQQVQQLMNGPSTGPTDQAAQSNALTAALEAQSIARRISDEAVSVISPVSDSLREAGAAFGLNDRERIAAQDRSLVAIQDALQRLNVLTNQVTSNLAIQLGEAGAQSHDLSRRVTTIEPMAGNLIDAASDASARAAQSTNSLRELTTAASKSELALEEAAADLGAKEQLLKQDQLISESVTRMIRNQEAAIQSITEQSRMLEQTSANETDESFQNAVTKLKEAQQEFAEALRAIGQAAVELSGQRQVANQPLREALQLASNLSSLDLETADESASATADSATADESTTKDELTTSPQQTPSPENSEATEDDRPDEAGGKNESPGSSKNSKRNSLGTGFISNAPDLTAEMMAGAAAKRAIERALQQQIPMNETSATESRSNNNQSEESQDGDTIESENSGSSKLSKRDGPATINQRVKNGAIERQRDNTAASGTPSNPSREKEQAIGSRLLRDESWHAKLPPELRKSIRAGVGQKPPRAYEERLKKYFQSVD